MRTISRMYNATLAPCYGAMRVKTGADRIPSLKICMHCFGLSRTQVPRAACQTGAGRILTCRGWPSGVATGRWNSTDGAVRNGTTSNNMSFRP